MTGDFYVEMKAGRAGDRFPALGFYLNEILRVRIDSNMESVGGGDAAVNVYMAEILRGFVDGKNAMRFRAACVRQSDFASYLEEHPPKSDRELSDLYRHNGDYWWAGVEPATRTGVLRPASERRMNPISREQRLERMATYFDWALTFHHRAHGNRKSGVREVLTYVLRKPKKYLELMDRVVGHLWPVLSAKEILALGDPARFSSELLGRLLVERLSDLHDAEAAGQPTAQIEQSIQNIRAALAAKSPNVHPPTGGKPPPN